VNFFYVQCAYI